MFDQNVIVTEFHLRELDRQARRAARPTPVRTDRSRARRSGAARGLLISALGAVALVGLVTQGLLV